MRILVWSFSLDAEESFFQSVKKSPGTNGCDRFGWFGPGCNGTKKSVKKKNFPHLIQESGTVIRATCAASPKSFSSTSFYHGLNWLERKCQARVPFGSRAQLERVHHEQIFSHSLAPQVLKELFPLHRREIVKKETVAHNYKKKYSPSSKELNFARKKEKLFAIISRVCQCTCRYRDFRGWEKSIVCFS